MWRCCCRSNRHCFFFQRNSKTQQTLIKNHLKASKYICEISPFKSYFLACLRDVLFKMQTKELCEYHWVMPKNFYDFAYNCPRIAIKNGSTQLHRCRLKWQKKMYQWPDSTMHFSYCTPWHLCDTFYTEKNWILWRYSIEVRGANLNNDTSTRTGIW